MIFMAMIFSSPFLCASVSGFMFIKMAIQMTTRLGLSYLLRKDK
jgi:hypothetical protein